MFEAGIIIVGVMFFVVLHKSNRRDKLKKRVSTLEKALRQFPGGQAHIDKANLIAKNKYQGLYIGLLLAVALYFIMAYYF